MLESKTVGELKTQENVMKGGIEMQKEEMNDKKLLDYINSIKVYGSTIIPKIEYKRSLEQYVVNINEEGLTEWEYDEEYKNDCRFFALLRVENILDIISTSGLTSISAIYKCMQDEFTDYVEDLVEVFEINHFEKMKDVFYGKCIEAQKKEDFSKCLFNAYMYRLCDIIISFKEHVEETTLIYTIQYLLVDTIEDLAKVIGVFNINKNLENLLIERFNKSILVKWIESVSKK